MEGAIFCCSPAWRKLLPPGVLGAERAEALAETASATAGPDPPGVRGAGGYGRPVPGAAGAGGLYRAAGAHHGGDGGHLWPVLQGQSHPVQPGGTGPLRPAAAAPAGRRRGGAPGISPAGTSGSCGGAAAAAGPAAVAAATDKCPLCVVKTEKQKGGLQHGVGMRFWRRGSFWRALRFTVGRRTAGRADLPAASAVASAWRTASAF